MDVSEVKCADLKLDPENVRKHSDRNLESVSASLLKFGQQKPIVVNGNGVVIAGNATLESARALGWENISVVKTDLLGAKALAYAIADNRTAELAEWGEDLGSVLQGMRDDPVVDHLATGFTDEEIDELLKGLDEKEVVEDEIPEPPADPITKPGDLWTLGDHRLLCGDSTKAEDVERLMGAEMADVVLTDPPYGVGYTVSFSKEAGGKDLGKQASYQESNKGEALKFLRVVPSSIVLMTYPIDSHIIDLSMELRDAGFVAFRELVWVKNKAAFNPGATFQQGHEPILLCRRAGAKMPDIKTISTVIEWESPIQHEHHPTQKPLGLWMKLLAWYPGNVFDPFLGSGTTLIAAEQLNRKCYGMEISPAYCDVIVKRWETLTGGKAELSKVRQK